MQANIYRFRIIIVCSSWCRRIQTLSVGARRAQREGGFSAHCEIGILIIVPTACIANEAQAQGSAAVANISRVRSAVVTTARYGVDRCDMYAVA